MRVTVECQAKRPVATNVDAAPVADGRVDRSGTGVHGAGHECFEFSPVFDGWVASNDSGPLLVTLGPRADAGSAFGILHPLAALLAFWTTRGIIGIVETRI